MDLFRGKVAIVTGGASGIGRALCLELGQRGAIVIVADINAEGAEQVASAIAGDGRARAAPLDVSREADVESLVDETVSEHRRLDYIFNNAGISVSPPKLPGEQYCQGSAPSTPRTVSASRLSRSSTVPANTGTL